MRKIRFIILCFLLLQTAIIAAETQLTLRSNEVVIGTIIFQNDDVVVLKDAKGNRFQYPKSEIVSITEATEQPAEEKKEQATRKVNIGVYAVGGAVVDNKTWGSMAGGDFMIGASNLLDKHIFLGGGVGYRALIFNDKTYSLMPLQLYTAIPLLQGKHAPYVGVGLGYGVALNKQYTGGLYAGIDFGWRMQISNRSALLLSAHATFQQLHSEWTETIDNTEYINKVTHTPCGIALKAAILF